LHVHVMKAEALQQLEMGGGPPFVLGTSATAVEIGGTNASKVLAEVIGGGWVARAPTTPGEASKLSLLMAVDLDLAVQGSSMVFAGQLYAHCSLECSQAARCAGTAMTACAAHV